MTIIKKDIQWVGSIEWDLKFFHGHELSIPRGTSYNSYLIQDEKTVLVDLVRESHVGELFSRIEAICPIEKIDYLIINHAEPDHASSLPILLGKNPDLQIICSRGGKISIGRHHPGVQNLRVVKTGDELKIGRRTLRFFEAQMLHWPDTMFTYSPDDRLLFSADAFGQHYASTHRFADEVDQCDLWAETMKYFANILTPYSRQILKKLTEFQGLGWEVDMIAPAHGVLWRKNVGEVLQKYQEWSEGKAADSAVILFDTIWGGTEKMARAIGRGLESAGVPYRIFPAGISDLNDVMTEVLKSRGILIGSPTLNNGLMPTLMPFLEELRGLGFRDKVGAAYGTFGWSGEGVKRIEEALSLAGIKVLQEGIRFSFTPNADDLKTCEEFGQRFARSLLEH